MALSEEIQARRRLGIAASDAAPIMGLSPYASPADIWIQKKFPDMVEQKKSDALYWGTRHEATIADEYALVTGQKLKPGGFVNNAKHPWIMCQPDRLIDGKNKGLECKTASIYDLSEWGPSGSDRIPTHYLIQVMHSMVVCGFKEWDLAVLIGGADFRIYHLFFDSELARSMWETEREFYEKYIKGDEKPQFDWGTDLSQYISKKYKNGDSGAESLSVDENGDQTLKFALEELLKSRNQIAKLKLEESRLKTLIQSYMETRTKLDWKEKNLRITWNNQKESVKIDSAAILEKVLPKCALSDEEKAAIFKECTELKTGARRFVVYDGNKE